LLDQLQPPASRPGVFLCPDFRGNRCTPAPTAEQGWVNDSLDIKAMLAGEFELVQEGRLAREKTTESPATHAFWAAYRRRG